MLNISNIASGFSRSKVNDAIQAIVDEINNNTLRRNGLGIGEDNSMQNDLDMNSKRILNLPAPSSLTEPLRLQDLEDGLLSLLGENAFKYAQTFEGDGTTTVYTLEFNSPAASIQVFIDGVLQFPSAYTIGATTITFSEAPPIGSTVYLIAYSFESLTVQTQISVYKSVKEFGAVGDGVTDDTAALQAAFNSGEPVIYMDKGTYLVSSAITISSPIKIIGEGTIKETSLIANTIILSADNIHLEGLNFEGPETLDSWTQALDRTTRYSFIYSLSTNKGKLVDLTFSGKRQAIYLDTCTEYVCDGMTVYSILGTATQPIEATAGQTVFPFSFPIYDSSIVTISVNGTLQTEGADYSVTIDAGNQSGSVTLTTPANAGDKIFLRSELNDNFVTGFQANAGSKHLVVNSRGYEIGNIVLFGFNCSENYVANTVGQDIHDNGIYNSSGNYSTFIGGNFIRTYGSGVKVRGTGHLVEGFLVTDTNLGVTSTGNGVTPDEFGANGHGTIIKNNVIFRYNQIAIECGDQDGLYPRDTLIAGNLIADGRAPRAGSFTGIRARGIRGLEIVDNVIHNFDTEFGMYVAGLPGTPLVDSKISGNTISAGEDGIRVQYVEDSIISDNRGDTLTSFFIEGRFANNNFFTGNFCNDKVISLTEAFICTGNSVVNNEVLSVIGDKTLNKIQESTFSYETGPWIPEYSTSGGAINPADITYDDQQGFFVRIGKMVFIQGRLSTTSFTPGPYTGNVQIANLPFTSSNAGVGSVSSLQIGYSRSFANANYPRAGFINRNQSVATLERNLTTGTTPVVVADLSTGAGNDIMFSATYFIDEE